MASMIDSPLFGELFTTEEMRKVWSDEPTIQKWLDVEAALARAEGKLGIIPKKHAQEITRKARVELIDMDEMKRQLVHTHHPIMALIRGFRKACSPQVLGVHPLGGHHQDIMDTGAVLQLRVPVRGQPPAATPLRRPSTEHAEASGNSGGSGSANEARSGLLPGSEPTRE